MVKIVKIGTVDTEILVSKKSLKRNKLTQAKHMALSTSMPTKLYWHSIYTLYGSEWFM